MSVAINYTGGDFPPVSTYPYWMDTTTGAIYSRATGRWLSSEEYAASGGTSDLTGVVAGEGPPPAASLIRNTVVPPPAPPVTIPPGDRPVPLGGGPYPPISTHPFWRNRFNGKIFRRADGKWLNGTEYLAAGGTSDLTGVINGDGDIPADAIGRDTSPSDNPFAALLENKYLLVGLGIVALYFLSGD